MSEVLTTNGITVGYLDINTMYEDSGGGGGGGGGETVEPLIVNESINETVHTLDTKAGVIYDAYKSGTPVLIRLQFTVEEDEEEWSVDVWAEVESVSEYSSDESCFYEIIIKQDTYTASSADDYPTYTAT